MNTTQSTAQISAMNRFMSKVYAFMSVALGLTAAAAYGVYAHTPLFNFITQKYTFLALIFAELIVVIILSAFINRLSFGLATAAYIVYSLLSGITLSVIFAIYQLPSIVSILLVSIVMFIAMALYGYYTKADLTTIGNILLMGLIGIVIAGVINLFFHNSAVDFFCAGLGVIIFTGLTAYDTQKIKELGTNCIEQESTCNKIALLAALTLYLDLVNLFLSLLRLFGKRKD
jgi:FtsH-binding integral membrane protein